MSDLVPCCSHCACADNERDGHDDTCAYGCNDAPAPVAAPDAEGLDAALFLSLTTASLDECRFAIEQGVLGQWIAEFADQIRAEHGERIAQAIEAVFADPERIRPLSKDATCSTDFANDAQWCALIARETGRNDG